MHLHVIFLVLLGVISESGWADWQETFAHYPLNNVYEKLVDNRGNGFEPLYGTRNFRQVLKGVVYRGGANNKFHRTSPRSNANPLPEDGLANLCQEGFATSFYLYSENYDPAKEINTCANGKGGKVHTLRYLQRSPMSESGRDEILSVVHAALINAESKPIYLHCWNGWHASGYISAIVLRQFCDWSAEDAVKYWDANTDGFNTEPQFEKIRKRIRDFEPRKEFFISDQIKAKVCG